MDPLRPLHGAEVSLPLRNRRAYHDKRGSLDPDLDGIFAHFKHSLLEVRFPPTGCFWTKREQYLGAIKNLCCRWRMLAGGPQDTLGQLHAEQARFLVQESSN